MSDAAYRPSRGFGTFLVAVWILAGAVLLILGFVLDPSSTGAMDGFERLVFTVIPIRPFAWIMSAVFLGLGALTARRAFTGRPTLRLSESGLEMRDGRRIEWRDVAAAEALSEQRVRLVVTRADLPPEAIELARFDLGSDVRTVVDEIHRRCDVAAGRSPDGLE